MLLPALLLSVAAASPSLDTSQVKTESGQQAVQGDGEVQAPAGVADGAGLSQAQRAWLEALAARFAAAVAQQQLARSTCHRDAVRVADRGPVSVASHSRGNQNGVFEHFRSRATPREDGGLELTAVFWSEWTVRQGDCCRPCACTCDGRCAPCVRCEPKPSCVTATQRAGLEGFWQVDAKGVLRTERLIAFRTPPPKPAALPTGALEVLLQPVPNQELTAGLRRQWEAVLRTCLEQNRRQLDASLPKVLTLRIEADGEAAIERVSTVPEQPQVQACASRLVGRRASAAGPLTVRMHLRFQAQPKK